MVAKKTKNTSKRKKQTEPVAVTPHLEEKRKSFQNAAAIRLGGKKDTHVAKKETQKHHSLRKRTVMIIIGIFLAVFGSAAVVYGFYAWQQTPEKVVADAITNAVYARNVAYDVKVDSPTMPLAAIQGSYNDQISQINATVRTEYPGDLSTIRGSAIATNKSLYVKVENTPQVVRKIIPSSQEKIVDALLPAIQDDIDNKWIKIAVDDTAYLQDFTKISSCVVSSIKQLSVSQSARTKLMDIYLSNSFFNVKEVKSQQYSNTYQLTIDQSRFQAFIDALKTTDTSIPFSKCSSELTIARNSSVHLSVIELEIDKASRTISTMTVTTTGENATTVRTTPYFKRNVVVEEPKDATRFDSLKSQFVTLFLLNQARQ